MAGEVVALKKSTEEHASEETKRTEAMRAWADDLACKVIKAVLEDAALRFLDDIDDEEQVDLKASTTRSLTKRQAQGCPTRSRSSPRRSNVRRECCDGFTWLS